MTVADTGHHGDVEKPAVMEHPTVSIAYHESEVTIAETVVSHVIRQMNLEITSQEGHVHHHILMTEVDTRQQRAGTALLILGETVGSSLGVMGVVKDIVCIQAITLARETVEDIVTLPLTQPMQVDSTLVILAIVSLDKNA